MVAEFSPKVMSDVIAQGGGLFTARTVDEWYAPLPLSSHVRYLRASQRDHGHISLRRPGLWRTPTLCLHCFRRSNQTLPFSVPCLVPGRQAGLLLAD